MVATKLIIYGTLGINQGDIELTNDAPNLILAEGGELVLGVDTDNDPITGPTTTKFTMNLARVEQAKKVSFVSYENGSLAKTHVKAQNINYIEVQDNGILEVINNELPLETIVAIDSTINLNNNYSGTVKTDIKIENSVVNLYGTDLPIGYIILKHNFHLNFAHNGNLYRITSSENVDNENYILEIKNIHKLMNLAEFINIKFSNVQNYKIDTSDIKHLKTYKVTNKDKLSLLAKQNGLEYNQLKIDSYIDQNFHYIKAITKDLTRKAEQEKFGFFENMPVDLAGEIFSYFDINSGSEIIL